MPTSRNCMIIWCTSEKIRTASQQKISWKKQRRILKRTKRVSFLQNSRSVYRNVLCHSLKMRPDRNQPRNQPDQVQSRQEAEVPQQNRRIHRQTGTMSLSKPSLNPKPKPTKTEPTKYPLLFRTFSTLWKLPLGTVRKWWHLSQN